LFYRFTHCKALELSVRLMSDEGLDLSSLDPGVPTGFGIRAGLSVGKPCYWSMLSLVFEKSISKLKKIYVKTLSRLLFTPYLVSLYF
jgi:hypothetical protein